MDTNERFSTQHTDNHTFEYDHENGSLRLSWKGGQTVLNAEEARDLLIWLYDDLRHEILPYRQRS